MDSTTKERIIQFIGYKNISKSIFLNTTDIKRGFLDKDKLGASVSDTLLAKIIASYPEVSLEWLITGNGNMINKTKSSNQNDKDSLSDANKPIPLYTLDKITNVKHPGIGPWSERQSVIIITLSSRRVRSLMYFLFRLFVLHQRQTMHYP